MGESVTVVTTLTDFITALTGTNGVSIANLSSQLTALVPWFATIIPFAFGYYVVRRTMVGGSHGKFRM